MSDLKNTGYVQILADLKEKIRKAQQRAAVKVNTELLALYWEIGKAILKQQAELGWGAKVIKQLSTDLKEEFPEMKGFSERNLKYMRAFAEAYPDFSIVQAPLAQIENSNSKPMVQAPLAQLSWYHHITLLDKVSEPEHRAFYIMKTIENGWSRNVMLAQIESGMIKRIGKASNNFDKTLPAIHSELAKATFKSPYVLEFMEMEESMKERDLERGLIQHLKHFMLELGRGFTYAGNQYKLKVENDEFFLDLLFFNYKLNRFVVFELKIGDFKPEYTGQLNFYINTVDEQIKEKHHEPTIGILLCRAPNKTVVEYALRGIDKPMGVSEYQFHKDLPADLQAELPTTEQLEAELNKQPTAPTSPAISEKLNRIQELIKKSGKKPVSVKRSKKLEEKLLRGFYLDLISAINTLILDANIDEQFESVEQFYWLSNTNHLSFDEAIAIWEGLESHRSEIDYNKNLKGFKAAGTKAFYSSISFKIRLDPYRFLLINTSNNKEIGEWLYDDVVSKSRIQELAEYFVEDLLESIEKNLERNLEA
jgi:predicted nuclease of restriction endonuclease-like (RecB) superfamily